MQAIHYKKNQNIADLFGVEQGITALVGGGGKTTLLYALADALSDRGRVLVTTSTHIFPPKHIPLLSQSTEEELCSAFQNHAVLCVGTPDGSGKLIAPQISFSALSKCCDYLLVESDGAKRLPLKAPAEHEPVLPDGTAYVIAVAGLDGIGKTISETAFRAERYASLLEKTTEDSITAQDVAAVLMHPQGQRKEISDQMRYSVLLNKADTPCLQKLGELVAGYLDETIISKTVIASFAISQADAH